MRIRDQKKKKIFPKHDAVLSVDAGFKFLKLKSIGKKLQQKSFKDQYVRFDNAENDPYWDEERENFKAKIQERENL